MGELPEKEDLITAMEATPTTSTPKAEELGPKDEVEDDAVVAVAVAEPAAAAEEEVPESPSSDVDNDELKWRGDPVTTFSDWKIEIVSVSGRKDSETETDNKEGDAAGGTLEMDTYHVHKCILAHGKRRSGYFARLFLNGADFQEGKSSTSHIELEPLAAKAFPYLLDYIYGVFRKRPLEITTQTATALLFMGEYFEIPSLKADSFEFCKKDLSLDNVHLYFKHATVFHHQVFKDTIAQFMAKNLMKIEPSHPIVINTDCEIWKDTLKYVDAERPKVDKFSCHVSNLITQVVTFHSDTLDKATFLTLTDASKIPRVDASVAMTLYELELVLDGRQRKEQGIAEETDKDKLAAEPLSSLQDRCVEALSMTWRNLKDADDVFSLRLKKCRPNFLVDLLVKSLMEASEAIPVYDERVSVVGDFQFEIRRFVDEEKKCSDPSRVADVWKE